MNINVGELFILKRELGISGYYLHDHYNQNFRKSSILIPAEKFEKPFLCLEFYEKKTDLWIKILLENEVGWIHVDPDQINKFVSY